MLGKPVYLGFIMFRTWSSSIERAYTLCAKSKSPPLQPRFQIPRRWSLLNECSTRARTNECRVFHSHSSDPTGAIFSVFQYFFLKFACSFYRIPTTPPGSVLGIERKWGVRSDEIGGLSWISRNFQSKSIRHVAKIGGCPHREVSRKVGNHRAGATRTLMKTCQNLKIPRANSR